MRQSKAVAIAAPVSTFHLNGKLSASWHFSKSMLRKSLICMHPWEITESLCMYTGMQRGACNQPRGI